MEVSLEFGVNTPVGGLSLNALSTNAKTSGPRWVHYGEESSNIGTLVYVVIISFLPVKARGSEISSIGANTKRERRLRSVHGRYQVEGPKVAIKESYP